MMVPNNEYKNKSSLLEKYIEGMSNRDKDSLIKFYEITKNDVYAYVLSILKIKEDAEDVFQEVYIKIYESVDLYQYYGKPLAWILTIARNLCYMKLRARKETIDIDDMYDLGSIDDIDEKVENKLLLNTILENINDEDRSIVVLHVVVGLKHREIAKMLNLSISTVLSKYHRAMKKLRKVLKEDIV